MKHTVLQTKRILTACLAVGMCLSALCACGTGEENPAESDKESVIYASETEAETQTGYAALKKTKYNRTFSILTRTDENAITEFYVEKMTGAVLDDAVYQRNVMISDDFGVTLNVQANGTYTNVNETLMNQVSSGLDEYDLYIGHKSSFSSCLQNNGLYDLGTVDTLDLTNPWWDNGCYRNMTVYGHTFLMVGDVNTNSLRTSSCFAFNKKMFTEMGKEYPYASVDNGTWTMDEMLSLTEGYTKDSNGDGKISYKDDVFGMTAWMMATPFSLFYGSGMRFVTMDEDGTPTLSYDVETVTNVYDKIYKLIVTNQAYYVTDASLYDTVYSTFTTGRALFCDTSLIKIGVYMTDMGEDYGILPDPKYDTAQTEYYSFVNGATTMNMVARSEKDVDFVGAILEAMGAYNYEHVTPTLYEAVTKLKNVRDPESSRMVDLIIRNRVFDFGNYADLAVSNVVMEQLNKKSTTISAAVKTAERSSANTLKNMLKKMEQYGKE